jgi:hypothetical protein
VQPNIAALLLNPAPPDTASSPSGLYLETALRLDQGVYKHLLDFSQKENADGGSQGALNVSAAMVFVNRIPTIASGDAGAPDAGGPVGYPSTAADCNPPLNGVASAPSCNGDLTCLALVGQTQAAYKKGLSTYFVVLNDEALMPQPVLDFYDNVASAAGTGVNVLDATSTTPSVVLQKFQAGLASVATCLYDLPAGVDSSATLSVTVPANTPVFNPTQFPAPITIASASGTPCNLANAASAEGWGIDNGHIRICGEACNNVQGIIGAVALAALSQGQDGGVDGGLPSAGDGGTAINVPDVPVDVSVSCPDSGSP